MSVLGSGQPGNTRLSSSCGCRRGASTTVTAQLVCFWGDLFLASPRLVCSGEGLCPALPSPVCCRAPRRALQPPRCSALQLALFFIARAASSARKTCLEGAWHGKQGEAEAARGHRQIRGWNALPSPCPCHGHPQPQPGRHSCPKGQWNRCLQVQSEPLWSRDRNIHLRSPPRDWLQ